MAQLCCLLNSGAGVQASVATMLNSSNGAGTTILFTVYTHFLAPEAQKHLIYYYMADFQ